MSITFYTINSDYCDYLRGTEPQVIWNMDGKKFRPFVDIGDIGNNKYLYFAPLRHKADWMGGIYDNNFEYYKIQDGNLGVIDFGRMIPVPIDLAKPMDLTKDCYTVEEQNYINLLKTQSIYLNQYEKEILFRAQRFYIDFQTDNLREKQKDKVVNFKKMEELNTIWNGMNYEERQIQIEGARQTYRKLREELEQKPKYKASYQDNDDVMYNPFEEKESDVERKKRRVRL